MLNNKAETLAPISSSIVVVLIGDLVVVVFVVGTFERLQAELPQSHKHERTAAVAAMATNAPVARGPCPCLSVITNGR